MFTIKYNRTTNHIAGIEVRTVARGETQAQASARGEVAYYAQNACGTITRTRLATGRSFENLADALDAARKGGRRLCKTCEQAAEAALAAQDAKPELPAGVTVVDGKVYGPVKALRELMNAGRARMTEAGDLELA
jgi:hypothetical protein